MTTKPYTTAELATMWERGQISAEQMLGQLLAHIALLQTQILSLQKVPQPIDDKGSAQNGKTPQTGQNGPF